MRRASEDAVSGLASEDVGGVGHGVDLGAKSVPWIAALHGIGGEVGNGVDGLAADDGGRLMEEGMEEDALESFNCLRTKMVVESDALGVGRTEEEATNGTFSATAGTASRAQ